MSTPALPNSTSTNILPKAPATQAEPIAPQPVDLALLSPDDLRSRVDRFCKLNPENISQFIQKEGKIRSLPSYNPIRAGYQTREEYESLLGESFFVSHIALSALGILALPKFYFFSCLLGTPARNLAQMERTCEALSAEYLFDLQGKAFLAGAALLLCASLTLYRQKTLGSWLHDPFSNVRKTQIQNFFLELTHALNALKTTNPEEAKKMAAYLLKQESAIEHALRFDFRLNEEQTTQIIDILRTVNPESVYQSSLGGKFS